MTVEEFERRVLELEEVSIVIRASLDTELGEYKFRQKYPNELTVGAWVKDRLKPLLGKVEMEIIDGNYAKTHPGILMGTLRSSYRNNK